MAKVYFKVTRTRMLLLGISVVAAALSATGHGVPVIAGFHDGI